MAVNQFGDIIGVPGTGVTRPEIKPVEIIASYSPPPLQKGCTLKGGNGVILAGTVLARGTDKKYVPYVSGGANGAGTPKGFLRETVDTGGSGTDPNTGLAYAKDRLANIVLKGQLKNSLLHGVDAGAVTALGARVDAERDYFMF